MLSGTEQICPGIEYDQDEPRSNINQYKDKKKKKKKQLNADLTDGEKYCEFCTIDTHDTSECYSIKKEQKRLQNIMARTNKSAYSSSSTTHFTATFIESELAAAFAPEADGDTDNDKDEEQVNLAGDESPILFIFDSGTTTHVTPHKHYLTNIQNVPEVNMTTAVRGQHPTIRQRGIVKLNDTWSLSDVAYLPNATSSLISEGRLCDAGFTITKSQEVLTVSKNGRIWLRGVRVNRLWVYCSRGAVSRRPINTLRPTQSERKQPESAASSAASSTASSSSTSSKSTRTIPKKVRADAAKSVDPANQGTGGAKSK